jgi:hypothetical protein
VQVVRPYTAFPPQKPVEEEKTVAEVATGVVTAVGIAAANTLVAVGSTAAEWLAPAVRDPKGAALSVWSKLRGKPGLPELPKTNQDALAIDAESSRRETLNSSV